MHIQLTRQCIQAKFKADLDGLLEFFERHPIKRKTITDNALKKHFDPSMNRFISLEGRAILAHVLLTAFQKQKDCLEDFDVPRFQEGLNPNELLRILRMYNLMAYAVHELCLLNEKSALIALQSIFKETDYSLQAQKAYFYPIYVKLLLNLGENDTDFYTRCEDVFIEEASSHIKDQTYFASIINLLRSSALRFGRRALYNSTKSTRTSICISRMYSLNSKGIAETAINLKLFPFGCTDKNDQTLKRKASFEMNNEILDFSHKKQRESGTSLKQTWLTFKNTQNNLSKHELAFISVCSEFDENMFPGKKHNVWFLSEQNFLELDRLKAKILNDEFLDEKIKDKKVWCVDMLMQRHIFFQGSVLKVMVQFLDLWASDIQTSNSENTFVSLIIKEDLSKTLLDFVIQTVFCYKNTCHDLHAIKKITNIFEKYIEHASDLDQLSYVRNKLLNYQDAKLPAFGSEDIWNVDFDTELTLSMNRLTITGEKSITEEDDNKRLTLISTLWPYRTVAKLMEYSISIRDRYQVIVPLMKKMEKIRASTIKSDFTSFPLLVFQDIALCAEELEEPLFREISLTMKHLLVDNFEDQNEPVILKRRDRTHQIEKFLGENVVMLFDTALDGKAQKSFKLGLYILDHFCDFPLGKDQDWQSCLKSLTEESYMSSNCLYVGKVFTKLLDNPPYWISLEEKEKVFKYIEKLAVYVNEFGMRCNWSLDCEPTKLLNELTCWNNCHGLLLWLDHLPALENCTAIVTLNEKLRTITNRNTLTTEQREWLFKVFLFSKRKSKESLQIIKTVDREILKEFYEHPYENFTVKQEFANLLHPQNGFSLVPLYPKLLVDFLGLVFETFSAENTIKSYVYNDIGLKYLINRLENQEMKQFFSVMYTIELIKDQLKKSPFCKSQYDSHYISGLVKVLKELNPWETMCQVEYHTSINRLSNSVKDSDELFNLNAVPHVNNTVTQVERSTDSCEAFSEKKPKDIKAVYYPILNRSDISRRSLSLLTIITLCYLKIEDEYVRIMISSLVLHVAESLIYRQAPNNFEKILATQTKNRASKWKKIKEPKIYSILRPTLLDDEKVFMVDILKKLDNSEQVLQMLESVDNKNKISSRNQRLFLL